MYVLYSEVRFVEISSPNECDMILKIRNEQTEPTDYMANCSTDDLENNFPSISRDVISKHGENAMESLFLFILNKSWNKE